MWKNIYHVMVMNIVRRRRKIENVEIFAKKNPKIYRFLVMYYIHTHYIWNRGDGADFLCCFGFGTGTEQITLEQKSTA